MKLNAYKDTGVFEELRDEWNELVNRSTGNRIFSTWEWHATWWDAYQPGQLWVITCRNDDNQLVGIAPLFISPTTGTERAVSIIGCKEVTDYLDLIVDKNHADSVLDSFATYFSENSDQFDRLEFCNLPEDSVSYTLLPEILEQSGFSSQLEHEDVCPVVKLPDSWPDYLAMLDKKQRHELRRKLRRAYNSSDWYIVDSQHDLAEEMGHFFTMMAASAPDKAMFLEESSNREFFEKITAVFMEKGWLQLCFLTVDGERAATYLNFDYNGEILVYNSGLNQEEYGHLSPGIILLAHNIQHAIETGHHTFDFLQGDETYKYYMGGKDRAVFNLIAEYKSAQ